MIPLSAWSSGADIDQRIEEKAEQYIFIHEWMWVTWQLLTIQLFSPESVQEIGDSFWLSSPKITSAPAYSDRFGSNRIPDYFVHYFIVPPTLWGYMQFSLGMENKCSLISKQEGNTLVQFALHIMEHSFQFG